MSNTKKITGAALALAAAGLMGISTLSMAEGKGAQAKSVHCHGVNSCKGHNDCKSASNACKGKASCKGKGFVSMSKSACDNIGGKIHKK